MQQVKLLKELKPLIVQPQWKALDMYLELLIESQLSGLVNSTDWTEAKEIQGRIKAYKSIRSLPDTIRKMENK